MGARINGVMAYRIRLPLLRPYHLAFGFLEAFDCVLTGVQADGQEGFGEATDCRGYYVQELADAWEFVQKHGPELPGQTPEEALSRIIHKEPSLSFAATPILTALEGLIPPLKRPSPVSGRIPLLGIVQGEGPQAITAEVHRLLQDGYHTLKLKVGFSVMQDLDRVRWVQSLLKPGLQLRLDANQGYNEAQARQFLEGLDPVGIELLEQPLKPGNWEDMSRLAAMSPVPLMLDEGIAGDEDLDWAIETGCAKAVKFKLMKCGSFAHLEQMINKASDAGLKVILGNGVATDIGCLHEALMAVKLGLTVHAGEMNGFLKAEERFLEPSLNVDRGDLVFATNRPRVRWDLVSQFALETVSWGDINTPG